MGGNNPRRYREDRNRPIPVTMSSPTGQILILKIFIPIIKREIPARERI